MSLHGFDSRSIVPNVPLACTQAPDGTFIPFGGSFQSLFSITFSRPSNTTAYTAGDVIGRADAGTAANAGNAIFEITNVGPAGGFIFLTDIDLRMDRDSVASGMGAITLRLYTASPDAILDNAAWDVSSAADRAAYVGSVNLGIPVDLGSTIYAEASGVNKHIRLAAGSTSLFALIRTEAGYTPASGTSHTLRVRAIAA